MLVDLIIYGPEDAIISVQRINLDGESTVFDYTAHVPIYGPVCRWVLRRAQADSSSGGEE